MTRLFSRAERDPAGVRIGRGEVTRLVVLVLDRADSILIRWL
jgi:hypothetical protein